MGTVAVAITADPAHSASPGDRVQVWATDPLKRVLTGEVRATVAEVVTLVVDEDDAAKLAPEASYRLVTLPHEARPEREFTTLLRNADETMGVVHVTAESDLVDTSISDLDVVVVAVRSAAKTLETIPPRARPIAAGETLYAIGRPDALRQLEARASPPDRPSTATAQPAS
jgi:uncharacterized protein with PhoU and TrkA domain